VSLHCRFCATPLVHTLCDLGMSPPSNAFLKPEALAGAEWFLPLRVYVCDHCWLVQLPEHQRPEHIFDDDYAYFSSYSDTWLAHARRYTEAMMPRLALGPASQVVEVASNDGYLLQYFKAQGVPVLGVEPAANCAEAARARGIPTVGKFFGAATARELAAAGHSADLLLGNNVLAHVPDLNDFVAGLKLLLKPQGVVTLEFPHLLNLLRYCQFDTIYHEHYSYLSLLAVEKVLLAHGLVLFDVEELGTHGGSLRVYARHLEDGSKPVLPAVAALREAEQRAGLDGLAVYTDFQRRVREVRFKLTEFLIGAAREGRKVWGYGAPAKGNTLLNYCAIRADLLEATVDRSPQKQGRFLPGTRIPVYAPERLRQARPDYVLILPWNLEEEIVGQIGYIREWGGRFVVPIPELRIIP
jgi:2-polyprenyl-3-methyl-5-hydroxy-6-metoxy-1,4-benzoquinol methylase